MEKIRLWKKRCISMVLMFCTVMTLFCGDTVVVAASPVEQIPVKVGFFESEGYHIMDEDGIRSGYGYDFLQMMLRYNDWNYEYVGYDADWGDMLDMLDSGEIDMVTLADKTPERLEKYDYSKEAIGTSSTVMTMRADNPDISIGNYSTYDGKRIGLVEGSSHNEGFETYAAEQGFQYEPVYYHDIDELLADLRNGKNIDIAVTSNMRKIQNEVILDEFNATDYYAIVKKGNEDLINGVNNAVRQLDVYSKDWRNTLFEKYYADINSNAVSLSVEEREYIQGLKDSGTVLKAAMNPELKPYSYFENGEAKGIAAEVFKKVAASLDIPYEILPSATRDEYKEQLNSGKVDIDLTAYTDYSIGQKYNLEETDSYMITSLAMLYTDHSNVKNEEMTVATVADPTEFYGFNKELIYSHQYNEYTSLKDCVEAVRTGKNDVTFCYTYMAEQAVAEDYTNKLQYTILPESSFGLSLGIIGQEDHRLLSIMNKGVGSADKDSTDKIVLEESALVQPNVGVLAFAYSNPFVAIAIVVGILVILFLMVLLVVMSKNQRQRLLSSYEFERFVSYVCESYDHIEEIDLTKKIKKCYAMKEDVLTTSIEPYVPYDRSYFEKKVYPEDVELMEQMFSESAVDKMWKDGVKENFFDCRVKDENGEYQWYAYVIKVLPIDKNHPGNIIVFKKNMQKIKEQEEEQRQALKAALDNAQKANTAKGAFVSKISHEIRTPLNAIIGYLNMVEEQMDSKEQVEHCVRNCKNASSHLLELINDVLDLSAIESNKIQIANAEFDFKEVVTEICNVYYSQAEQKKVKFMVDIHGLTEERMVGDPLRTKQIMMNLLSNAVKFTPAEGIVHFIIEQVTQSEKDTHIRFIVKDTGIGMDENYKNKLFSPFEQENADIARNYGGSGLGLSITKNLVDLLNGSISVKSEKNVGTEFTVILAFDRCAQTKEEAVVSFKNVRALIACAKKENADYLKSLLKRCGVKADVCETEEKVLKRIEGRKGTEYEYDLCLVDDTEKELDGRSVCAKIIEQDPKEHPEIIPIVYSTAETQEAAYAMGIRKIIEKPLFQSSMLDMLMNLYGKERAKKKEIMDTDALKGMHVILAEDNEMNMEIAVHILTKAGIIITKALDGIEASEAFLKEPAGTYQAILMDIQMPRMDGYTATKKIRSSDHPEAKTIPIIALTANAFSEDVSKAISAGMNEHISKPVDDKKLYRVLSHIFSDDDFAAK